MATFTRFNTLTKNLAEKVHNLASDQLMVALTNTLPVVANTVLANLTEIAYTNLSSRVLSTTSSTQTSGVYKLVLADLILTASGGTVGPFRYVVIYNNTATNKELIGFIDYGAAITLADGETITVDSDQTNGLFTL